MPLVILMRRQHLNNMTFFGVSQKCHTREGEQYIGSFLLSYGISIVISYFNPWALKLCLMLL